VEKMEPPEYAALLLLRRLLPDRVFDGVIRSIYKRFPGQQPGSPAVARCGSRPG
jgi:hypothetical protein